MLRPMRVAVPVLIALAALPGCARSLGETPTEAEAPILAHLGRDAGVRTMQRWRDDRGNLRILTRQGGKECEYVIMPGATGALELRRIVDGMLLPTVER
ncbi:MAG: hypothetical protein RLZZ127_2180 [Planctomycetota bacterium]|jgi:hypothetical protein